MYESITPTECHFTACASLAALGVQLKRLDLFGPIRETVLIAQKTVKHSPSDKLYDAFISVLAGAHGLVEINSRLRADPALQAAFGRSRCAENVKQMEQAMDAIYQKHSQCSHHDYRASLQVLDVDMSGMPCGPKAAFAAKGYFANQRNRRGRQLGRVLASGYEEIVVDRLFVGTIQLSKALRPLMEAAEVTLKLNKAKRHHTLVRVDAGGGSLFDVNWLLTRGYQVHCKDYSSVRTQRLAQSVEMWVDDLQVQGRQIGWVTKPASEYIRPVRRIAVRCRKQDGQWAVGVLISTLTDAQVLSLTGQEASKIHDPVAVLLASVWLYDQRGGGIETSFKGDKQGLGIGKRGKKRFEAQQMVMLLGSLAHNVVVWSRSWLAASPSKLQGYGTLRMVRDAFHVSGFLVMDAPGQIVQIVLNQAAPLASPLVGPLHTLLAPAHVAIQLGQM